MIGFDFIGAQHTGKLFNHIKYNVGTNLSVIYGGKVIRLGVVEEVLEDIFLFGWDSDFLCDCGSHERAFRSGAYEEYLNERGLSLHEDYRTNEINPQRPSLSDMEDDYHSSYDFDDDEEEEYSSHNTPVGVIYDGNQIQPVLRITYKYCTCKKYLKSRVTGFYKYKLNVTALSQSEIDNASSALNTVCEEHPGGYIMTDSVQINEAIMRAVYNNVCHKINQDVSQVGVIKKCIVSTHSGILRGHVVGDKPGGTRKVILKGLGESEYYIRVFPHNLVVLDYTEVSSNRQGEV